VREAFGELFAVPAGYLNTASIGIPSESAGRAVAESVDAWRRGATSPPDFDVDVAKARAAWAQLVGVPAESVAIGATVSQLAALVAGSVPDGTRVLTVRREFTSVSFPFAAHASRGVTVTEVPDEELADAAREHDLVAVSVVQSADGVIADLDGLRAAGTPVLLDVTQATGWLPLDLGWAQWVVGSAYKWLLAPRGVAWLAERRSGSTMPLNANWYAGEDPWDTVYGLPLRLAGDARRLDTSPIWLAHVGAAVSVPWLASLDMTAVRDHCVGLADGLLADLGEAPRGSAIVSLDRPDAGPALRAAGIVHSMRAGRVRLAFHLYSDERDVDLVLTALGARP
jgi:selenocysteine lyase/cysteine desulfurase